MIATLSLTPSCTDVPWNGSCPRLSPKHESPGRIVIDVTTHSSEPFEQSVQSIVSALRGIGVHVDFPQELHP